MGGTFWGIGFTPAAARYHHAARHVVVPLDLISLTKPKRQ
jgi:hypothetical protein